MNLRRKLAAGLSAAAIVVGGGLVATALTPSPAAAHGATMFPGSRQFLCWQNADVGGVPVATNPACANALADAGVNWFWNWFANLHPANAGGTVGSIPDGRICDGADAGPYDFTPFNEARNDWPFTHLTAGATYEFRHNNWAPHPGRFDTYVTRQTWNPNTPLTWAELELVHSTQGTVPQSGGSGGLGYYFWDVTLPQDRSGYHNIFVHWVRSDSPENFFSCSDVVFDGGNGEVEFPTDGSTPPPPPPPPCNDPNEPASTPGPALISGIAATSAVASWGASAGCATAYEVLNVAGGGEEVLAEVTGQPAATSTLLDGLTPDTLYQIAIRARNDNIGQVTDRTPEAAPFTTLPEGGGSGDCTVTYAVNDWGVGFTAEVTVVNNGDTAINGWNLDWSFPSGQQIDNIWNAVETPTGASNASWNPTIGANGGSTNFGFLGSPGAGGNPTAFILNGTSCTVS